MTKNINQKNISLPKTAIGVFRLVSAVSSMTAIYIGMRQGVISI